jgi:hypothetical protein
MGPLRNNRTTEQEPQTEPPSDSQTRRTSRRQSGNPEARKAQHGQENPKHRQNVKNGKRSKKNSISSSSSLEPQPNPFEPLGNQTHSFERDDTRSTTRSSPPGTPMTASSAEEPEEDDTIKLSKNQYSPSIFQTSNRSTKKTASESEEPAKQRETDHATITRETPPANSPHENDNAEGTGTAMETDQTTATPTGGEPTEGEDAEDDSEATPLEEQLKKLQEEAAGTPGLEIFTLFPAFGKIQIEDNKPDETAVSEALADTQWTPLPLKEYSKDGLKHISGNSIDFIRDDTVVQIRKAIKGEDHTLGISKMILVDPIHKMLVRVVGHNCQLENQMAWCKHAVRSALSAAKVPLDGLAAILDMHKPGYDWKVIALSKQAHEALTNLRGLFDPRSKVAVLFRPWEIRPQQSQTFPYSGVVNSQDKTEGEIKLVTELFISQLNETLKKKRAKVSKHQNVTNDGSTTTFITITFENAEHALPIFPMDLPKRFRGPNQFRPIRATWLKRCSTCHSESHYMQEICPWRAHSISGNVINTQNAKLLKPGQAPKRPRETEAFNPDDMLFDARPAKIARKVKENRMETDTPTETHTN